MPTWQTITLIKTLPIKWLAFRKTGTSELFKIYNLEQGSKWTMEPILSASPDEHGQKQIQAWKITINAIMLQNNYITLESYLKDMDGPHVDVDLQLNHDENGIYGGDIKISVDEEITYKHWDVKWQIDGQETPRLLIDIVGIVSRDVFDMTLYKLFS